ncbi:hypothetical protein O6H91_13G044000 [Diphasiastrum complanatum]|uniref:Uncharacterized protein n=1 Tax=Diphasiastrum complanatum TaxID=34168 RepID=A0ACC2BUB5_DIPCM|nr:hypothetical protein O6H91_13G044000 [Diphasiastrum complanatum]
MDHSKKTMCRCCRFVVLVSINLSFEAVEVHMVVLMHTVQNLTNWRWLQHLPGVITVVPVDVENGVLCLFSI